MKVKQPIQANHCDEAVVELAGLMADRLWVDVESLDPLYDVVDPAVVGILCDERDCRAALEETSVSFQWCGQTVVLHGTGEVEFLE